MIDTYPYFDAVVMRLINAPSLICIGMTLLHPY